MFLCKNCTIASYQYNLKSGHVHSHYRGIYGPTLRHTCGKAVKCISALCIVLSCWALHTRYMWSALIRSTAARQKKMFSRRHNNRCPLQLPTWRGSNYLWQWYTHTHTHTAHNVFTCGSATVCTHLNKLKLNVAYPSNVAPEPSWQYKMSRLSPRFSHTYTFLFVIPYEMWCRMV